jgi:hypothetical protein
VVLQERIELSTSPLPREYPWIEQVCGALRAFDYLVENSLL